MFPTDIAELICSYVDELYDWIRERIENDRSRHTWEYLSMNPSVTELLAANQKRIDLKGLSRNPNIIEILNRLGRTDIHNYNWEWLADNPNAIDILLANPSRIEWEYFPSNTHPKAIEFIAQNWEKLDDWYKLDRLSRNVSASSLLAEHLDELTEQEEMWSSLSCNEGIIDLLEANLDKVDWKWLSANKNAVHILEQNLDKVDWQYLSTNENAIHLLEANPDNISWWHLSQNKNAMHIVEQVEDAIDKIEWYHFTANASVEMLERNLDKIHWDALHSDKRLEIIPFLYRHNRFPDGMYTNSIIFTNRQFMRQHLLELEW